jgi:type IV secretory pathway VirB10-like protein
MEARVGGEGTPEYNSLVDEENTLKAASAKESGKSYVPIPAGGGSSLPPPAGDKSPLVRGAPPKEGDAPTPTIPPAKEMPRQKEKPQTKASQAPEAARRREAPGPETSKDKPIDNRAILGELRMVKDSSGSSERPVVLSFEPMGLRAGESIGDGRDGEGMPGSSSDTKSSGSSSSGSIPSSLKIGDVLYAVVSNSLNSDIPSPVMVSVVEGKLKGAKALGSFRLTGEYVLLSFDRLITKEGLVIGINAVGVDPDTSEASVRSRVDTHFWERWGSLMGASFIEGLGRAAGRKNTRVYVNDNSVVEDGTSRTIEDITLESLEKVGQRAANQVERGFDRLPTVTVKAGEHVGLLILDVEK